MVARIYDDTEDPVGWWRDVVKRWIRRGLAMRGVELKQYASQVAEMQNVRLPPRKTGRAVPGPKIPLKQYPSQIAEMQNKKQRTASQRTRGADTNPAAPTLHLA